MTTPDRWTTRAARTLDRAAALAAEDRQQAVTALHLLAALLEERDGVVAPILDALQVAAAALEGDVLRARRRLPTVSGSRLQPYAAPDLEAALEAARRAADELYDEYVATEHLLLGLMDPSAG